MTIFQKIMDLVELYGKLWTVSCTLSIGSFTGGYYDEQILNNLNEAIDDYENSKLRYVEKWSKKSIDS